MDAPQNGQGIQQETEQVQRAPQEPTTNLPSEQKKVFLVDNPVSGTTDAFVRRETFLQHFENRKWVCEVHATQKDESLNNVVKQAVHRGANLVVASGGDGTVAAVASGLVNTNIPLGIIPAGTGNILARDLTIPLRFDRALEILTGDNEIKPMDAMQVDDKVYLLNLGVGLSSEVMAHTDRERKRRFGILAYVLSFLGQLAGFKLRNFYIQVDDQRFTVRASEIMVVNSSIVGIQKFPNTIDISPHDGQLDVCIFRARTVFDVVKLLVNVLLRRPPNSQVRCISARKKITIRSDRRLTVQADGEIIGKTPLEVRVLPGVLQVVVPKANS